MSFSLLLYMSGILIIMNWLLFWGFRAGFRNAGHAFSWGTLFEVITSLTWRGALLMIVLFACMWKIFLSVTYGWFTVGILDTITVLSILYTVLCFLVPYSLAYVSSTQQAKTKRNRESPSLIEKMIFLTGLRALFHRGHIPLQQNIVRWILYSIILLTSVADLLIEPYGSPGFTGSVMECIVLLLSLVAAWYGFKAVHKKFSWLLFISIQLAFFWRVTLVFLVAYLGSVLMSELFALHLIETLQISAVTTVIFSPGAFVEEVFSILLIPLAIAYVYSDRREVP